MTPNVPTVNRFDWQIDMTVYFIFHAFIPYAPDGLVNVALAAQHNMTKLLLLCIFVLSLSLKQSASSNWWSPYKWRHYWEDWWEKLEEVGQSEGIPLGQQKPERVPNADG